MVVLLRHETRVLCTGCYFHTGEGKGRTILSSHLCNLHAFERVTVWQLQSQQRCSSHRALRPNAAEDVFTYVSTSFAAQESGYRPYAAHNGTSCLTASPAGAVTVAPAPGYDVIPGNPGGDKRVLLRIELASHGLP